ncbi:LURP1-like domain [Macleaya cordata]|uniref:LURP1-like domain n=1 Tax=Macleaya cordata TaxID=56857 RepID=A0A200QQE3_MACCD|nr:LURP1-like domain [Macleaya cordata]
MSQQNYPPIPNGYPMDQQPLGNPYIITNQPTYPPTNNPYIITNQPTYPPPPPPFGSSYIMGEPSSYPQPPHHQPQPSCPPLPPLTKTVSVISPHFCAPYPVDLTIIRKLMKLTEDNFAVKDVNGNIVFHIKDELTLLRERRVLLDAAGNPIVTMQEKIKSAHRRFQVFKGGSKDSKDLLFSAKQSSWIQFSTKLDVFLATNTREDVCDFRVQGSWLERSCIVYAGDSNTIIAQMHKKHTVESVMLGKDTFTVTVYPNIDYAFIVALIVILDAINDIRAT